MEVVKLIVAAIIQWFQISGKVRFDVLMKWPTILPEVVAIFRIKIQ